MDFIMLHWPQLLIGIAIVLLLILFFPRYRKVPPNQALIISGPIRHRYRVRGEDGQKIVKKFGYRIVRGGTTFVIPLLERVDTLNLGLMQVDIKTGEAVPSQEYIPVNVDGVANIKIGTDDVFIATAAEQLLNRRPEDIAAIAQQVLEGNMREIIGRMTIADLVQNRDKFAAETTAAAASDMANMGLEIINLTIQNFRDTEDAVAQMSTRNIEEKKQEARIAIAQANQEASRAEAESQAKIAEQNRDLSIKKSEYKQAEDTESAKAAAAYDIQCERTRKELETEKAAAELLRLQKETELRRQNVEIEREKLNIVRETAQAEKDKKIAEADAERYRREAEAEAELYMAQKEAEAIEMRGRAEADALRMKAEAMQQYGQAAMMEMLVNKLPDIAEAIGKPLAQTDKIILFGEGAATGLTRDITGSMLQTFEAMKEAVGLDIPKMLKDVSTGGLLGRQAQEAKKVSEAVPAAEAEEKAEALEKSEDIGVADEI